MKAQALVIILDYGRCRGIEIQLKDGALDRVYGNGVNPDPAGFGPHDIQHKHRNDD
jgi:Zn-finger nucleic acid-binding protein